MERAAERSHNDVVRLYRELGASNSGRENIVRLFRNWGLLISSYSLSGQQTMVLKTQCDYGMSEEPLTSTRV